MGQQNSKILTKSIQPSELLRKQPVQVGLYFYPFKHYSDFQFNQQKGQAELKLQKPYQQSVKIQATIYSELQKAIFQKTLDIKIQHVLFDTFNFQKAFYMATDFNEPITFIQRKFKQFQSQLFKNILYEKHIYQTINRLQCPNLIKMNDSFCINSNLEEEKPWTYFFVFENLDVNLSQIIKYRRQNNCEWFVSEFEKLCWDLVCALDQLHQSNITHNDIRPFNVYYSMEKQAYVLTEFSNALKTDPNGTFLNLRSRIHPSFAITEKQLQSDSLKQVLTNHKRADIYALGITLLCAFYMTQPVQRKFAAPINRKMQEKYDIMKILRKMVSKSQNLLRISDIKEELQKCNKKSSLSYLIQSIRFRQQPKIKHLPMIYQGFSSAYKRLGLWDKWKFSLQQSYQVVQDHLTPFEQAKYFQQLARVEKLLENYKISDEYSENSAVIYHELGMKYLNEKNYAEAFNSFQSGMNVLNYCVDKNKIVLVKILQSLSLLHAQRNQLTESMACLNESKIIFKRFFTEEATDFQQIKQRQAKIYQMHDNFDFSEKVLKDLLQKAKAQNQSFKTIEYLKRLGQLSIKRAQFQWRISQEMANPQLKLSSPLRKSQALNSQVQSRLQQKNYPSPNVHNQNQIMKENYEKAEQHFLEASQLVQEKISEITKSNNYVQRVTIDKNINQLEDYEIQFENLCLQNLQILKYLGQIKYKEGLIERAEDHYYKILSELEKIFVVKQLQLKKDSNTDKIPLEKKVAKKTKNLEQMSNFLEDSRKDDFSYISYPKKDAIMCSDKKRIARISNNSQNSRKSLYQQKRIRLMNFSYLTKLKADIECSIALCKQHTGQHKQMLNYYNKSLTSYKIYFGQFHNKLCGIIIGSMALGYQKVGQHNKAISCIEIASQILRDVQPTNSPDLKHFEKVRQLVLQDQKTVEKRVIDRTNIQSSFKLIGDILSNSLGLKKRESTKRISLKSLKSLSSQKSRKSIQQMNHLIEEQKQYSDRIYIQQAYSQHEGSNDSLIQIQLPLKVNYLGKSQNSVKPQQWQIDYSGPLGNNSKDF